MTIYKFRLLGDNLVYYAAPSKELAQQWFSSHYNSRYSSNCTPATLEEAGDSPIHCVGWGRKGIPPELTAHNEKIFSAGD